MNCILFSDKEPYNCLQCETNYYLSEENSCAKISNFIDNCLN